MKTYIMEDVLTDHTSGLIVVKARDPDHAWEVLEEYCDREGCFYVLDSAKEENGVWKELESVAYVEGGA